MNQCVTVICEINTTGEGRLSDYEAVRVINELVSLGAANACHLSPAAKTFLQANGVKSVCVIVPPEKG